MTSRRLPSPRWWPSLGGPNAITLAAWLLTLPGAIATTYTIIPDNVREDLWIWAVLGGSAHVLTGLVLLAGRWTVLRPVAGRSRPWVAVGVMLLAGGLRGFYIGAASIALGHSPVELLLPRTLFAAWSVLIWYSIGTIVVDATRRHRAQIASLEEALAVGQALAEGSVMAVRELRSGIVTRTEAIVAEQLEKAVGLAADPQLAAAQLHQTVEEVIRPLSHEMNEQALREDWILSGIEGSATLAMAPIGLYIRGILLERPFLPWGSALLLFAVPSLLFMYWFGAAMGLAMLVLTAAAAGLVVAAGRALVWPRLAGRGVAVHAIGVVGVWTLASVGAGLVVELFPGTYASISSDSPRAVLLVLEGGMAMTVLQGVALMNSVLGQWRRTEVALAEAVRTAEWSVARLRQMAWSEQRHLGGVIHGDVQARIVSLALQIQLSPPADTAQAVERLRAEVHRALGEQHETTLALALDRIRTVWRGAVGLEIVVDPDADAALARDPVAGHAVAEVLSESITNAVRHGGAHRIRVRITMVRDALDLLVEDDGASAHPDGPPGMGSRLLDAACMSWSRSGSTPTLLHAVIACAGARAPTLRMAA